MLATPARLNLRVSVPVLAQSHLVGSSSHVGGGRVVVVEGGTVLVVVDVLDVVVDVLVLVVVVLTVVTMQSVQGSTSIPSRVTQRSTRSVVGSIGNTLSPTTSSIT
jgi:uncharacterized membrane protein